jgi:choline kinase
MKVIVMAAGVGSRLASTGYLRPKCLLKAGGETLVSRLLRLCRENGLYDVSVVAGFQYELVEREVRGQARCYCNPLYDQTNSLMSLWYARDALDDDVLLMNGDLFFTSDVLQAAIHCPHTLGMLADRSRVETADYRFAIRNGLLARHGKHLTRAETDAEYVGIAHVRSSFLDAFHQRMEQFVRTNRVNDWWEEVLYSFISDGVPIYPVDVTGHFWTEVDCAADLDRLTAWLALNPQSNAYHEIRSPVLT